MIDLLTASKSSNTQLSSLIDRRDTAYDKKEPFYTTLDKSLSNQQSLREEDTRSKIDTQRKKLETLTKKIESFKDKNPNTEIKEEVKELINSLEQTIEFLQNSLEGIENNNISSEVNLSAFIDELTTMFTGIFEQFEQGGDIEFSKEISSFIDRTLFVVEGLDSQLTKAEQSNIAQLNTIINNIALSMQDIDPTNNSASENLATQNGEIGASKSPEGAVIVPDDMLVTLESLDSINASEEADSSLEFNTVLEDAFSEGESSSDQDSGDSDNVNIVDMRSKKSKQTNLESVSEPFTLEQLDSTVKGAEVQNTQVSAKITKNDMATQLYSTFSSAVSRVQVEALMQNVSGKISMILRDGGNELRMKLTPPELGQMKLSFVNEDGMMRGKVIVETPEAKLFFEQNINNLRESLANAGVTLGSVDVELGNSKDFSSDQEQEQSIKAIRAGKDEIVPIRESSLVSPDVIVDFTA